MTHRVFGNNLKEPVKSQSEFELESFDPSERSWIDELPISNLIYCILAAPFVFGLSALAAHWFGGFFGLK